MNYCLCFSPAGGTKKTADLLASALFDERTDADLLKKDYPRAFAEGDVVLVAVPSYGGRVPVPAAEILSGLEGNGAKAVLLCAYGNRDFDDTLLELSDILEGRGFLVRAAAAAVAEHSIMRSFAAGRPDTLDAGKLYAFGKKIRQTLEGGADKKPDIPGKRPYVRYNGVPLKPRTTAACTECGICAAECPVGAIDPADPRKTDRKRCISCMRCTRVCPVGARVVDPRLIAGAEILYRRVCVGRKEDWLFL